MIKDWVARLSNTARNGLFITLIGSSGTVIGLLTRRVFGAALIVILLILYTIVIFIIPNIMSRMEISVRQKEPPNTLEQYHNNKHIMRDGLSKLEVYADFKSWALKPKMKISLPADIDFEIFSEKPESVNRNQNVIECPDDLDSLPLTIKLLSENPSDGNYPFKVYDDDSDELLYKSTIQSNPVPRSQDVESEEEGEDEIDEWRESRGHRMDQLGNPTSQEPQK